jgi:hypothetical protein
MTPTREQPQTVRSAKTTNPPLSALLSRSDDEFYGRLQGIWNNVLQLEDMGLIQDERDKFVYAYQFAEAELQRLCTEKEQALAQLH